MVTIVLGYTHMLAPHIVDGPGRELLDGLMAAAARAELMADRMMALSHYQAPERRRIDLDDLVHELADLLRRLLSKQITVVVQSMPSLSVLGDHDELSQVILNLSLNARDAMPHGGTLTLRTEISEGFGEGGLPCPDNQPAPRGRPSRWIQLQVADTGNGMTPETLQQLFQPYFTTRPGEGHGIGLATVRRIVAEHGGWMECRSEVGYGTCFDVYLPLASAEAEDAVTR